MILVIADDITGAAELGGIGLRYGLRVLVADDIPANNETDLLVVYTNTRSLKRSEAVKEMEKLAKKAKILAPSLFYRKTDSVLRGHVAAELTAQMNALEFKKTLLVPVNPSLGRIIRNGQYFINGQPVDQTSFASDPEFPIRTSLVTEILEPNDADVTVMSVKSSFPATGIVVGEAETDQDLSSWAAYKDQPMLFAGAASFFDALLKKMFVAKHDQISYDDVRHSSTLLISGTTYRKNVETIAHLKEVVSYMPEKLSSSQGAYEEGLENWAHHIVNILRQRGKAIIATGHNGKEQTDPEVIREILSDVAKLVLAKHNVQEVFIEGGSTAFSVVQKLGWKSFIPVTEWQLGVVKMRVVGQDDKYLTIKPGSYDWPAKWNFN